MFLGPAFVLGLPPDVSRWIQPAFDGLALGLVLLQSALLLLMLPNLLSAFGARSRRVTLLAIVTIQALALGLAVFLTLGPPWAGLGPELLQAVWLAAPLALWATLTWPRSLGVRTASPPRPVKWILVGFPLIFFTAGLARIDFAFHTGAPTPTAVAWLLAYLPTLVGVALALVGWMTVRGGWARPTLNAFEVSAVAGVGLLVAVITSLRPATAFVLSATITFGSGYQLFPTPPPLPPLALSLFLVSVAGASLLAAMAAYRRDRRPIALPLLALAAVLSGIFPIGRSVLGALVALQLLRLT
ncbi:MAG: hypothetical protein R3291_05160, partial [Thermoplasmata archaeon]|nr:hypothetical protein [Thermoplasmata archaeon]